MPSLTSLQNLSTPITTSDASPIIGSTIGGTLTYNSNYPTTANYPIGSLTTTNIGTANSGLYYYDSSTWVTSPSNPLQKLYYTADFQLKDTNKRYLLVNNIKGIKKNKMLFNCNYDGNRIQPYEFIMSLIESKEKMSVKIKVSDILTICYTNLQFTKIENNLSFNSECDFSVLKVKFKCDKILYENHKLSEKELRTDKLKKILKEND